MKKSPTFVVGDRVMYRGVVMPETMGLDSARKLVWMTGAVLVRWLRADGSEEYQFELCEDLARVPAGETADQHADGLESLIRISHVRAIDFDDIVPAGVAYLVGKRTCLKVHYSNGQHEYLGSLLDLAAHLRNKR